MIKSEYDEQADFLANLLKNAVIYELSSAAKKGLLKHIKPESINDVAEIVYQYFKEFNRPLGGGIMRGDINDIIEEALREYAISKLNPDKYYIREEDESEWAQLLAESRSTFAKKVSGIDVKLEDGSLEDLVGYNYLFVNPMVEKPIFEFAWISNSGAFSMTRENEDGIAVRLQFFDDNGKILPKPIRTKFINHEWVPDEKDNKNNDNSLNMDEI